MELTHGRLDEPLKPCPLCGSPARLAVVPLGDDRVECELCGCNVPGITAIVAITKWNAHERI